MITTNFTKLLEIDVPLVVAPMIGSTGGALAGAAACSGGLGIIGVGGSIAYSPDWVRDQWAKALECTKGHVHERTGQPEHHRHHHRTEAESLQQQPILQTQPMQTQQPLQTQQKPIGTSSVGESKELKQVGGHEKKGTDKDKDKEERKKEKEAEKKRKKEEKKEGGKAAGGQRVEAVSGTITFSQDRDKKKNLSVEANVNFGQRGGEQQQQQQQQQPQQGFSATGDGEGTQLHYGKTFGHIETRHYRDLKLRGGKLGFGFIIAFMAEKESDPSYLAALEMRPSVLFFSCGDIAPFVKSARASGAFIIVQVTSAEEALDAKSKGADVIVLQNSDAGGHGQQNRCLGQIPLITVTRDLLGDDFPLLSAGGIVDGRGFASALTLGADGVMMGTRFLASVESLASEEAKQKIVRATGTLATQVTSVFDRLGSYSNEWMDYTARALKADWIAQYEKKIAQGYLPTEQEKEMYARDPSIRAVWAGASVHQVKAIESTSDIFDRVIKEAIACFESPKSFRIIKYERDS